MLVLPDRYPQMERQWCSVEQACKILRFQVCCEQVDAIKQNKPLIIVGTPGRLAELSRSGVLHSHGCRLLVLDEVFPKPLQPS